ncbi:hypothetical protein PR002_g10114 [Phytophthora rubi]|uniref:Uncharacterized protein n=1 Tax=Phytophthora rubi TaxID=129364 RepID=A0A6A3MB47_9STRA|nr:hypothetical protein PR002_g10114 [Phytophthora rubi]
MQARHIGLDDGKKVLSVEVVTGSGERVVSTRAVMKQAPMAFVFTGQGSAAVNMDMDRYQESSVACEIWNRGDVTQHGCNIREHYMNLKCEDPVTVPGRNAVKRDAE